jgi:hypothetical protein
MTTDRRRRSTTMQLELPLGSPSGRSSRRRRTDWRPKADRRPVTDWRLDEQTRRIGRQGIAAARALLQDAGDAGAAGGAGAAGPGNGSDGGRGQAGRAA